MHSFTDLKFNSTQLEVNVQNFCSMQIRNKRHTCLLETTNIKDTSCWVSTMLKVIAMHRFSKAEYREIDLLYGECRRKARSAAQLYMERFPAGPHPSFQTILSVVKLLREAGCVTSRARSGRPAKV